MFQFASNIPSLRSRLRRAVFDRARREEAAVPAKGGPVAALVGGAMRNALSAAPAYWREGAAERLFRRAGAPGPAAEHVFQYLLDRSQDGDATVMKGADNFYARQYRQYFNPVMGVFAMTAEMALLGCGGAARGARRRRSVHTAMVEETGGVPPIIVLDHQSVAVPLLLPAPAGTDTTLAIDRWLSGRRPMPEGYRALVAGDELRCVDAGVRARRRCSAASVIEVADAVRASKKLAILALHPRDPDAMGLHITLFDVDMVDAQALAQDYAFDRELLAAWRRVAEESGRLLRFFVGGTEEVFTQCSQNLFIKRRAAGQSEARRAQWPNAWSPVQPLETLIARQFELFQATVSASGLPGVSPRNGDIGKAAFVRRLNGRVALLIPYFVGNAVHGHAAKLWSNPQGAIVVWDDHTSLAAVTLAGPSRVVAHGWVARKAPDVVEALAERKKRSGAPAAAPEYWFVQEIEDILLQDEPLSRSTLDPARPTCSIHASGQALHGKKPAYFAADTLPAYDQKRQHHREARGRPVDPTGASCRRWERDAGPQLAARLAHLATIDDAPVAP